MAPSKCVSYPQLAPGRELFVIRKVVRHLLGGVAARQRALVPAIQTHTHTLAREDKARLATQTYRSTPFQGACAN